jgi:pyruvate dehydrogenase E2 component (dihydrolipoamide acetyltransferase)
VDIAVLQGSGPGGRVVREDVEAAARGDNVISLNQETPAARKPPPPPPPARPLSVPAISRDERREPFRGVRRTIAERMQQAHQIVPPVTHVEECDVTQLDATRKLANERDPEGQRLTYLPFIVKAVVAALKDHPALNASLDEQAGEIVFHGDYNIGVAVDTPAGLVVPVVKHADQKRLRDIAADIDRLAAAARNGTISSEDLRGGTFTVTSPGPFGGLMATPIVMHPQSGILGVHRATDRPVVRDGQIVVRKMMNLSITFDHRILDGMTAAKFALEVVELLEHPAVLALES